MKVLKRTMIMLITILLVISMLSSQVFAIEKVTLDIEDSELEQQEKSEDDEIVDEQDETKQEDEEIENEVIQDEPDETIMQEENLDEKEDTEEQIVVEQPENSLEQNEEIKETEKQEPESQAVEQKQEELSVEYRAHVQDFGWQNYVTADVEAGTTGQNKKIEALNIKLVNNTSDIKIKYNSYIEGIGWQGTVENGEQTGTTGQNLKMEVIRIWLEGTDEYSIAYQTHIQDLGWQDWVYDGEISGNLGDDKKIEAIKIKIVPKVEPKMSLSYSTHVQDLGWEETKQEYDISGTTGQNKKMEAIKIDLNNALEGVDIKYKTYDEFNGWQEWKKEGEISGTTGLDRKVYGIRIKLEGTEEYSVQYRVHVQDVGWMDWVKNGEVAGKISQDRKIEAIQIRIIKENNPTSKTIGLEYYTYLQGSSVNEDKIETDREISGTTGENRKIEAISIELTNAPEGAHIEYSTHIENIGWTGYSRDGQVSGIINGGLKIEAIKIRLVGLDDYTIEYKTHVQDKGWTGWNIDDEISGTTGQNKKIEAVIIGLKEKEQRHFVGIDVSKWQGEINFDQLVASNKIDYIIPRIAWYSESKRQLNVDEQFERNYREAKARNIPLGAYFYSYATSIDEARREAEATVNYLKSTGCTDFDLPIFFDIEDSTQVNLGKDLTAQIAITYCEILKNAGFKVGVYSYENFFNDSISLSALPGDYSLWVANFNFSSNGQFPAESDLYRYSNQYDMWQYTDMGTIDGINGAVDMDICYRLYY